MKIRCGAGCLSHCKERRKKHDGRRRCGIFSEQGRHGYGEYHSKNWKNWCVMRSERQIGLAREDIDADLCHSDIRTIFLRWSVRSAGKDQKRALDLYYELLALKEPPMRILFLMTREYRLLFHVKGLMANGYGKKEIASKAGDASVCCGKVYGCGETI